MNNTRILKKIFFAPLIFLRYYFLIVIINLRYKNDNIRRTKESWILLQSLRNSLIHKLKHKYKNQILQIKSKIEMEYAMLPHERSKNIWICWLQGLDNAPELVKACVASTYRKFSGGGYDIHIVTLKNYREYVDFPEFIIEKYQNGIISPALFSDFLRLQLLLKYGGTWIDATVFCTENEVPEYMMNSELFFFQGTELERNLWAAPFESYFMTASQNNKILMMTNQLLLEHFKKINIVLDYLILYDFLEIAIEEYPQEFNKMIPCPKAVTLLLAHGMFGKYEQTKYENLISLSPFHKLSYKAAYKEGSIIDCITKGKVK